MLACDDEECHIEWFHLECLRMDEKRASGTVLTVGKKRSILERGKERVRI